MMLHPFDFPDPATPPAGKRREDATLSFSRRVKIAFAAFAGWYGNMRPCDRAALDSIGVAGGAIGLATIVIVILHAFGIDVVSHLPSLGAR
jgi:hypothetical protein